MSVSKKGNGKAEVTEKVKTALPAILLGIMLTATSFIISSLIYFKMNSQPKLVFCTSYLFSALSSMICGYLAEKRVKGRGITVGGLSGAVIATVTLLSLFPFSGFDIGISAVIIGALQILFSSIGGILAANSKKRY